MNKFERDCIEKTIESEQYHVFDGTTTTVCALNIGGVVVVGQSAFIHEKNFDKNLGKLLAREDALRKHHKIESHRLNLLKLMH